MQTDNHYSYKLSKREERHYKCLGLCKNGHGRWEQGGYLITWEKVGDVFIGTIGSYKGTGRTLKEALKWLRKNYMNHPEFRNEVYDHVMVTENEELSG